MEEKIYQKLKAGLTNSSLSERTIRAAAKRMALKVNEETQITEDFITDGVELLKELNGQLTKDVAEIVKKQTDKPIEKKVEEPQPKDADDAQSKINEMLQKLSDMEKRFQESQRQAVHQSIKAKAAELLRSKKADREYILQNALAKVEIADTDTPDTFAEKVIPIYDREFKLAYGDSAAPRANSDAPPVPDKARLEEFKKAKGIGVETKK